MATYCGDLETAIAVREYVNHLMRDKNEKFYMNFLYNCPLPVRQTDGIVVHWRREEPDEMEIVNES